MSTAPVRPSRHAGAVSAALAAILCYFLSAPAIKYSVPGTWTHEATGGPRTPVEHLAGAYAKPYEWLQHHTPLRLLLEPYAQWWFGRWFLFYFRPRVVPPIHL